MGVSGLPTNGAPASGESRTVKLRDVAVEHRPQLLSILHTDTAYLVVVVIHPEIACSASGIYKQTCLPGPVSKTYRTS